MEIYFYLGKFLVPEGCYSREKRRKSGFHTFTCEEILSEPLTSAPGGFLESVGLVTVLSGSCPPPSLLLSRVRVLLRGTRPC